MVRIHSLSTRLSLVKASLDQTRLVLETEELMTCLDVRNLNVRYADCENVFAVSWKRIWEE